nr:hypothetical protein [Tanacetum cinerariifolium]
DPYVEVALHAPPSPNYIPGPEEPEQSPECVPVYDLDVHPEDDDDEDPEEDPVDYLADGGDDGDDEEGSSEDDEDNDMDIEADEEEEEEEHPAPADSIVVASTATDQAPSAEETEPFETDESAATPPLLAMSSLPASPLSPWSSPPPQIPFPPLPPILSPPSHVLSPAPPPSLIPGGLRADYGFVATMDREIMHDPEREVGYGITDSWDEIVEALQGAPVSTDMELGGYIREFETRVRQDTDEIYIRRAHAYTRHLMETEARMSRKAWVRSTDASDLVRGEVMSLCTTVLGQMTEIRKLHVADRRRQTMILEMLRAYHMKSTEIIESRTALHGHVTALQAQVTALQGQQGLAGGQKTACYECGVQGHFKRECPKLKNNDNHGNQGGKNNAPARVYAVGRAGTDPDINVVTADGRIIGLNTIFKGCTLNLLNHPFNIDLMPVELGSFDAIIGIDWLAKYQAAIVCAEKIVRIPWGNETLIIHGDGSNHGNATRLSIISCTKTEKYMMKGFPIFLAHITTKEVDDKSKKKQLEDVPIV